jgi:hypothetical protein
MTKRQRTVLLASTVLTLAASVSPPARATNYVVALAAKPQAGAKDAIAELLQGLYRKVGPGDTIVAYDATDSSEIARIDVPQNPAIATNRNYKAKAINEAFGKLWDFVDAGESAPGDAGAIAIPRLLMSLASIRDALPGQTAEAIAVGSMLYSDAREPTFSMAGGFVPTDAHLRLTQDQSPYGVAGRGQALQGVAVHFCYTNPADDWTTDVFRQRVGRLWALSTILQGGRFGSFGPLDRACIDDFLGGTNSSENFAVDRTDTKPTMRKYERVTAREPVRVTAADTAAPHAAPAPAEALFQGPPCTTAPAAFVGPLRIGIKWDCPSCDLDLYARSRPQSEWLYYGHRLPADGNGFFDHDFTAPPSGGDAYEYIQFNSVDLRAGLAARVNFYGGSVQGGPSFRLRVWFAGCAYDAPPQRIAAPTGNRGRSDPANAWLPIDVLGVVGLRDQATHF